MLKYSFFLFLLIVSCKSKYKEPILTISNGNVIYDLTSEVFTNSSSNIAIYYGSKEESDYSRCFSILNGKDFQILSSLMSPLLKPISLSNEWFVYGTNDFSVGNHQYFAKNLSSDSTIQIVDASIIHAGDQYLLCRQGGRYGTISIPELKFQPVLALDSFKLSSNSIGYASNEFVGFGKVGQDLYVLKIDTRSNEFRAVRTEILTVPTATVFNSKYFAFYSQDSGYNQLQVFDSSLDLLGIYQLKEKFSSLKIDQESKIYLKNSKKIVEFEIRSGETEIFYEDEDGTLKNFDIEEKSLILLRQERSGEGIIEIIDLTTGEILKTEYVEGVESFNSYFSKGMLIYKSTSDTSITINVYNPLSK